ncbi:MAG TPA: MotA/TolQ/ExbB proton channel family protein [Opitutaceae bacterium]|jgi:biopolymer transport protein ExbB
MKLRPLVPLFALLALSAVSARADSTFDQTMSVEAGKFQDRVTQAARDLISTRDRITSEKAPLLVRLRAAEDRILAAEQAVSDQEFRRDQVQSQRTELVKQVDAVARNDAYFTELAADALKTYAGELGPVDRPLATRVGELQHGLTDDRLGHAVPAAEVAEFLTGEVERSLGGYALAGTALVPGTNELVQGTFAHLGPDAYFVSSDGMHAGAALPSTENLDYPVVYPLADWSPQAAAALVAGQTALVPADASGGKALRLHETQGDVVAHVQRGGWVAYAIVAVGLLAVILMIRKAVDLLALKCASRTAVGTFLREVKSDPASAQNHLSSLARSTRRLFAVGLAHRDEPTEALEERLEAELMQQRLQAERRLPLLAVIATAAPLMGLLGTVVGMVRTFALITVFGTGNAAKLASGISEVLITTELGLVVAVPTLIVHGFLSHRIQNQLAILERQALEFVTMVRLSTASGLAESTESSR